MADGFVTWGFDEKRYRYTFTDVERRMRVINKKSQDDLDVLLNKLGKDIRHKTNTINKEWYRKNGIPESYRRAQNRGHGDILHLTGYSYDVGENSVTIYYKDDINASDHGEYGNASYRQLSGFGQTWGEHAGWLAGKSGKRARATESKMYESKQSGNTRKFVDYSASLFGQTQKINKGLDFSAYIDFIETGGESWRNLGKFPKNRIIHPTNATKKVQKWIDTELNKVRKEVWQIAETQINAFAKDIKR